ncbi:hypothetical protein EDD22DRAFT_781956 [Suillus occidentalis]|nr:hypothetical protein EDD22DRAFT_781956 [Suillus occidentalis]
MVSILVGISKAALAMARLIIDGEDRRPRPFIVPICKKRNMFEGVGVTQIWSSTSF